jgi:mRNA interferase MazF
MTNVSGVLALTSSFCATTRQKTRFTIPCVAMFGEIFISQFPFTSGTLSKIRPALVLFDSRHDVIICRITSAQRGGPLDITPTGWQAAGLLKPSITCLDRLVTAEKSVLPRRLGTLSAIDIEAVRTAWNQQMRLS